MMRAVLLPFLRFYDQGYQAHGWSRTFTGGGVRMGERPGVLSVQIAVGLDGGAEEVVQATLQLRRELLDLDVDTVEVPGAGEPPPGSRAVDVAALGALVVNLSDPQLLTAVVAAVRS